MPSSEEMETFVRVVEGGSMSAAARDLGVPRSTVSRQLSRLEDRLGVRLLQRTTRKLAVTEAGHEYFKRARGIVADIHEAEEAVLQLDGVPRGLLRIAAPLLTGNRGVAEIVADFMATYPEVTVEVRQANRRVDLVAEGFDLAIRGGMQPDSSLIAKRIAEARRVAVASVDYLDRRGRPATVADLADHDCLRFVLDDAVLERAWPLIGGGHIAVDGPLASNDPALLYVAAAAGRGIALVPVFLILKDLEAGTVETVLPDLVGSIGSLSIVYPAREHLPAKVRAFIDFAAPRLAAQVRLPPGCDGT